MTLDPVLPPQLLVVAAVVLVAATVWCALTSRGTRRAWALRGVMVLLLLGVALRPVLPGDGVGPVASGGLEVYFAVDTTSSMAAEDVGGAPLAPGGPSVGRPPTRLDAAKADIAAITGTLAGAQFSLTTFDGSAVQRVPLTSDASALRSASEAMTQEITYYSSGSSIDEPLEFLTELLAAAQQEHPDRRRVIFYLGDGEQTRQQEPASFDVLAPYVGGGAVLGYGTDEGGPMRIYSGFDEAGPGQDGGDGDDGSGGADAGYIQDPEVFGDAVSRLDRTTLQAIAAQLQVPYLERADGASVETSLGGIDVGEVEVSPGSLRGPVELYWILAIPLGLLALREATSVAFAIAAARPRAGASA